MPFSKLGALICAFAIGAYAQTPQITANGVLNGGSFVVGQAVAPGSIVSIFGSDLAASLQQGDTIPLSDTLNDVSVTFAGIPAGLYFVSSGQINAQLPWNVLPAGTTSGTVDVVVTRGGVASAPSAVQVAAIAPGIFSIPNGEGYAVAINNDGSIAAPAGAIPGFPTHPANAGDVLILYATGVGPVENTPANGADSMDMLRHTLDTPVVLIGGQQSMVYFSGLTPQFPGVNQINVGVPSVSAGDSIPIQLQAGGITSTDKVVIAVAN